jgi:hypothetical protein
MNAGGEIVVSLLLEFELTGDLSAGVYQAALPEVLTRFAVGSRHRQALGARLKRIYNLAKNTGRLARFIVFGSFVSAAPALHEVI